MRHDDFYLDCPGKRNRLNGGVACLAGASDIYYPLEDVALFCFVVCKFLDDIDFIGVFARRSVGGQSSGALPVVVVVYHCFIIAWFADFDGGEYPDYRHARVRYGVDDAGYLFVGDDFYARKYAGDIAMDIEYCARKMVYNCGQETDD